jgi:predicted DNA binding protein
MLLNSTKNAPHEGEQGEPEDLSFSEELKQATIEVDAATDRLTPSVLRGRNAIVKMVSCRPYGEHGMMEFIELVSHMPVEAAIDAIRADPNTKYVNYQLLDKNRASCIIVTKNSPVCSALSSTGCFCRSCAIEMDRPAGTRARWEVTFSGETSLNSFLSRTKSEGITPTIGEFSDPKKSRLTFEQEEVLRTAHEGGYFGFPRRTSLKDLSAVLSRSPSTLEEVLRRAEGKIIADHVNRQARSRPERKPESENKPANEQKPEKGQSK